MVMQLGNVADLQHPLLESREVVTSGVVAISADKGLAGSFNTNVVRDAVNLVKTRQQVITIPIGRKMNDAFRRNDFAIASAVSPLGSVPEFSEIAALADFIGESFINGKMDRVELVFSQYGSQASLTCNYCRFCRQLMKIHHQILSSNPSRKLFWHNCCRDICVRYYLPQSFPLLLPNMPARVSAMSLATENADDLISRLTMGIQQVTTGDNYQ